jgi:hypothetical protein
MTWEPAGASCKLEKLMEKKDAPEQDRDELRRFAEFLARQKDKKEGKKLDPMPPEMKAWLLGE